MNVLPVLMKDGYKVGHKFQYPPGTTGVYSNLTPRNSRRGDGNNEIVFFGLQFFVMEYLLGRFQRDFFDRPRDEVVAAYKRRIDGYLGLDTVDVSHIGALHDLGYLPLRIKALPEGTLVPYGVPVLTIVNTHPAFFWLTNMLETLMSSVLWKASTSATTAFRYRQVFDRYAALTGSPPEFVPWQGHDFSFRGMCGVEDAAISGAAHLLSFTGTDTIPAIDLLGKRERAILAVLAAYPQGRTHRQIALLTGYSAKASTIGAGLSDLRKRGYVTASGTPTITADGRDALGDFEPLPTGPALLAHWRGQLGKRERLILDALLDAYPASMDHANLCEATGYSPDASTVGAGMSLLRGLELVDGWRVSDDFADAIR